MKYTAIAPANIAFIKYWGKADEVLRTPLNDSVSMNLSEAFTTTTVETLPDGMSDTVTFLGEEQHPDEERRVLGAVDRIRREAGMSDRVRIVTRNSFPKGIGAAASASGFAALTLAVYGAFGIRRTEKELTIAARLGSGSACRSIPDGFVLWEKGESSDTSFARSLYPHDYWDLMDILVIVDPTRKKVSTSAGMEQVRTSPYWKERVASVPDRVKRLLDAFEQKDIHALGAVIEEDCLSMHHVMQTQEPPLDYFNGMTRTLMELVPQWRAGGIAVFFTIDAGPNVHLISESRSVSDVTRRLEGVKGIRSVIVNRCAPGAHESHDHLF